MPNPTSTEQTGFTSVEHRAPTDFLSELAWRGLLHQSTDEEGLRKHLADAASNPRRAYAGFDPTADSLTIGNLIPIMVLVHFQRCGHQPVVIMGGGTGMIGDPSGKSEERQLMTVEMIDTNVNAQKKIFQHVWQGAAKLCGDESSWTTPPLTNNADWLTKLSFVEVLRDTGKHFSVNMMIQKDSVRDRLHNREQGISFTEFSYMILQAYDFAHLFRTDNVTIQLGGSDQWGNIVAGGDLIRRTEAAAGNEGASAFGLTAPLVTKSDGGKFGKTESGAIWLSANRTSPYAFFQFWLNTDDGDLEKFLKLFTVFSEARIAELMARHEENPGRREAHRALAMHMTALLHGQEEATHAQAASKALFSGNVADLPLNTLTDLFANVPSSEHDKAQLAGEGIPLIEFLLETTLAKSKRESREFLTNGSVSVNGEKVGLDARLTEANLLHGTLIALRRGKKSWHVTSWT